MKKSKRKGNRTNHPRKPICNRGHEIAVVGRNKHGKCKECDKINSKKYQQKHKRKVKKYHKIYGRKYDKKNKKAIKKRKRKYYLENIDYILLRRKKYWKRNRKRILKYRKKHPEIYKLAVLRAHKKRGKRIPKFGQRGIKALYKNCPKNKTVDHIIPLCGRKVSGLHVIWNLQYLTKRQNSSKHNKVDLKEVSEWYGKILKKLGLK